MLFTIVRLNKPVPPMGLVTLLILSILILPMSAAAVTKSFANLDVPSRLMINGVDSSVPTGATADSIKVKWNWDIENLGNRGGKFRNFEVLTKEWIKYDNPRNTLNVGDSIGTPRTRLSDQAGQPCIVEIEWTMVGAGTNTVGLQRSQDFPPESPYPGHGTCP